MRISERIMKDTNVQPLERILLEIPDMNYVHNNLVCFADHKASEQNTGIKRPDYEFEASDKLDYFNILPFSSMLWRFFPGQRLLHEAGFHFFDVDQTGSYGALSQNGSVLIGNFDVENITGKLVDQDYDAEVEAEAIVLKSQQNPSLSPENPLRQTTVTVQPNLINSCSSSVFADLKQHPNLYENPIYRSAASALLSYGSIRQVQFVPASWTRHIFLTNSVNPSRVKKMRLRLQKYKALPQYLLTAFGDVIRDGRQYIVHLLVYKNQSTALQAQEALDQRTQIYYKMPEFIESYSGTIGIRDLSVWGEIKVNSPHLHQSKLTCVLMSLERPLPEKGSDFDKSRIDNLYRVVVERVHNRQADYLNLNHSFI